MQPIVVTYAVSTTNSTTAIAAAQGPVTSALALTSTTLGVVQQRLSITSGSADTGIYFHIVGTNQAGFPISEFLQGGGAGSTVQSNLDYLTVKSITPSGSSSAQTLGTTASTVSAGLNGVGSTLWFIQNWHVTPTNIEVSGAVNGTVNWGIQYTYDDPNNLPSGVGYPQPFNHPSLNNMTTTLDGPINDPITAWRLIINSGTGSVRATGIQAGIGGP